jgi:hypothetical protein
MVDDFRTFSVVNRQNLPLVAVAEIGILLLIHLNFSVSPISAFGSITASIFPLSADWLSAISFLHRAPN